MATPTTLPAAFVAGQVLTAAQQNALRGAFRVLQVVSTTLPTTFTTTSTSYTDITGLSVSITPSSTSSQILVFASVNGSEDVGVNDAGIQLVRGSTAICVGTTVASRTSVSSQFSSYFASVQTSQNVVFLDSPATVSATTYKVQVINGSAGTAYINRGKADTAGHFRAASTITVMEISA